MIFLMEHVRWGIVGCGDVCEVKSGPAFRKCEGSSLVAVMRRDGAKAQDYARRHGVPRWYDDATNLIADPEVNAVYVATPPNMHEAYALQVAAAGKPCYVEKPMSRNAAEARRMTAAFGRANLPLFVAFYRRGMLRFLTVKRLLEEGALGQLTSIEYRYASPAMPDAKGDVWRLDAEVAGGGLFLDLGSHALDLMDFFFGPLRQVAGKASGKGDVEETVDLRFVTGNGVPGHANWSFVSPGRTDRYTLTGTEGTLSFTCFGHEPLVLTRPSGAVQELPHPTPEHVQQGLIQQIVDFLRGKRPACEGSAVAAVRTQEIMDAAVAEYYGGREDGFWKRVRRGL